MAHCFKISIIDEDPDYLRIEIFAANDRFAGTTRIYAGLDQLTEFAAAIAGFPVGRHDERRYTFGTKDRSYAGGHCAVRFYCGDGTGHGIAEVEIEDDRPSRDEFARFRLGILAADIDNFVSQLRRLEKNRTGEATLHHKT